MARWFAPILLCSLLLTTLPAGAEEAVPAPSEKEEALTPPPEEPAPAPESCPEEVTRELVARAFWLKAQMWLGSKNDDAGRLLLRDLTRDFPDSDYGRRAQDWLDANRGLEQSGKTEWVIGATLNGSLLAASLAIGFQDHYSNTDEVVLWTTLGGALAGLGTTLLVAPHINVSDSQAGLFNFSGIWGFYNGLIVYDLLYPFNSDEAFLAGAVGMVVGMGTSGGLWKYLDVDEGAAQFAISSGVFTFESALLLTYMIGGENVLHDNETAALLALLLPSNAAVVGGYFAGRALQWPADDLRYISLGGFLGNLLGGALLASFEPDSVEAVTGIMFGSLVGSLALSTIIVRPWRHAGQPSKEEAALTPGLVVIDEEGVRTGLPMVEAVPFRHQGQSSVGFTMPILSVGL